MIQHICNRCGKILPVGRACTCQTPYKRDYNRFRRDKKIAAFRASAEWRAVRQQVIDRDGGLDQYVLQTEGVILAGFSVHHILPLSTPEGWARRLDPDNLITLSDDTHSVIEYRYKGQQREPLQHQLFDIVKNVTNNSPADGA